MVPIHLKTKAKYDNAQWQNIKNIKNNVHFVKTMHTDEESNHWEYNIYGDHFELEWDEQPRQNQSSDGKRHDKQVQHHEISVVNYQFDWLRSENNRHTKDDITKFIECD